jgi:hypothetical protein
LLTHYRYHCSQVRLRQDRQQLEVTITTAAAEADLHVIADLDKEATELPAQSPFVDWHQARLFAGPLPFTFDHEPETNSIVVIEGVRESWKPRPVHVEVLQNTFFNDARYEGTHPRLASAFHIENVNYRWKRGVIAPLLET